jgi:membrane protein DedA with SNARE-associated domain
VPVPLFSDHHLAHLVAVYGPGLIGALVWLEAMGLPLPAESLLIATAAALGTTRKPGIAWIVAAAAAGAILGDNCGYLIGYSLGWRALRRWGRHIGLSQDRLLLGAWLFRRHGGKVVFFGRFIVLLRTVAALLAGANRMQWRWFLPCNAAGGILWACLYGLGAYWLGDAVKRIATPAAIGLGVVALAMIVAAFRIIRRHEQELVDQAKAAMADGGGPAVGDGQPEADSAP